MKTLITTIIATLVMGLTVNAGTKVRIDYDQNASFDHLRTYSWANHDTGNDLDQALSGSLVSDRIYGAIDAELSNLGYKKVDPGEADFLIHYSLSSEEKTEVTTFGGSYGYGGYGHRSGHGYGLYSRYHGHGHHGYNRFYGHGYGYGGYGANSIIRELLEVTLSLDIIDTRTGEVIWRSWAIKSLKQRPTPKKVRKFITRSVHKTLKEFPPEDLNS
ncbi:MAG: DUF4136 domain-containing protein [candidate division Zixibacteria bacterium]|nr:DUF4136 domain-containing protein [candidate division Zixibacteria bacterium]